MSFSEKVLAHLYSLTSPGNIPDQVQAINPFNNPKSRQACEAFYNKFYSDNKKRVALIGINPGRFGGAITGVPFTDPVALEDHCGIKNDFEKRRELSSRFVYDMIAAANGPKAFYSKYFFATMYPLALIKEGKNFNYYDSKPVFEYLKPDIIENLQAQAEFGLNPEFAVCLGKKNFEILSGINETEKLFKKIAWIEHPRYIQQYKSKSASDYITKYLKLLSGV